MNEFDQAMKDLWQWTDGKTPHQQLPAFVHERINWVVPYMEEGLSYAWALQFVLGYNEPVRKKEFEYGGEWLPVSEEFEQWRGGPLRSIREMQIAVELIYGERQEAADDDANS
ncbi:hypothetical protein [Schleiferilactobacillus harbinensis]|uniref:Uncharacterized protein n=1 Tax=Schleiferilactobacillus harbinensis TaxID=304207 RepID=A0A5P2TS77_9LACO|nr:hypothetical protein [Schleiferilactobacillus harbinensis]QEU46193.1 hypothetical protein FMM01_02025 [Schleiferilactobacillus harbinensis]QFR22993.1 hypothetical protein D1010_05795 [Schleiferilactobacillus harbinensis]